MKTQTLKSTRGGTFEISLPTDYKKIKLPSFKKWVTALESGEYRQCTGTLCERINGKLHYCCLGVLSKVQGRLQKTEHDDFTDHTPYSVATLSTRNPLYDILGKEGDLPENVTVTRGTAIAHSLINCNDSLKLTFKDIAKIIRMLYKA